MSLPQQYIDPSTIVVPFDTGPNGADILVGDLPYTPSISGNGTATYTTDAHDGPFAARLRVTGTQTGKTLRVQHNEGLYRVGGLWFKVPMNPDPGASVIASIRYLTATGVVLIGGSVSVGAVVSGFPTNHLLLNPSSSGFVGVIDLGPVDTDVWYQLEIRPGSDSVSTGDVDDYLISVYDQHRNFLGSAVLIPAGNLGEVAQIQGSGQVIAPSTAGVTAELLLDSYYYRLTDPAPVGEPGCDCPEDWRVELLTLATGVRKRYVQPISFDFDTTLNEVGNASVTLPVRLLSMADVWPHLTSVAITRVNGPNATPEQPFCEFIGMVEEVSADSGGTLTLGLKSIENYLSYRVVADGLEFDQVGQNKIASDLVNYAYNNGPNIPLTGAFFVDGTLRDRFDEYQAEQDAVILDAVVQLTQIEDGPDWWLVHNRNADGSGWSTQMIFVDFAGNSTPKPLNARRGLTAYSLSVDASEHRTWERARGSLGAEVEGFGPSQGQYPRFDKAAQYSEVDDDVVLNQYLQGDLWNERHPYALPEVTVADLDLVGNFYLGDVVFLQMNHGAIQYEGLARIVRKSWSVGEGQPALCTLGFVVPKDQDPMVTILGVPWSPNPSCCGVAVEAP